MKIETHIITWNRSETIHLTLKHYLRLGKVIIHDNFSEDNTREIAEACGAEIQLFGNRGVLSDQHYLDVKNNVWKESKADLVIVVDDDEILWHPDLTRVLTEAKESGCTIIRPKGYSMYSNEMPVNAWMDIKTGIKDEKYSKLCIFNPRQIQEIRYVYGCHEANPRGNLKWYFEDSIYLLHYHAVGGVERMIKRHQLYEPRRQKSPVNMRFNLGVEYGYSADSKRKWFSEMIERSSKLDIW